MLFIFFFSNTLTHEYNSLCLVVMVADRSLQRQQDAIMRCHSTWVYHIASSGSSTVQTQGESPRAAGGLFEGAADCERERTVYNIVMIQ